MLSAVYRKLGGHGNAHPDLRYGRGPEVALGRDAEAPTRLQGHSGVIWPEIAPGGGCARNSWSFATSKLAHLGVRDSRDMCKSAIGSPQPGG